MNWDQYLRNALKAILAKGGSKYSKKGDVYSTHKKKVAFLSSLLVKEDYKFSEWLPTSKPKKDGGHRIIVIPPFYDRVVLRALASLLSKALKNSFSQVDDISFAYQKGKGVRDALMQLKSLYTSGDVILKVDIRKFFDNIDKEILHSLLNNYNIDKYVRFLIEQSLSPKLTTNEYHEEAVNQIKNGIPQGNAISAVLSNLMLLELDMKSKSKNFKMIRYADDMVFVCKNTEDAHSILNWLKNYLKKQRHLDIHPLGYGNDAKTLIISNLKKNKLIYLGVEFDGENLFPTKECQERFVEKIDLTIKSEGVATTEKIAKIKTCINQWCGYYAFTDITRNSLDSLGKTINQLCNYTFADQWAEVNLVEKVTRFRTKQSLRGFHLTKFGENYNWLMIYD